MRLVIVVAGVSLIAFACAVVLAIMDFRSTGESDEGMVRASRKETGRTGASRRLRALWSFKGDRRAELLPADATVTFAAERRASGIDEVLTGLDRDLVGLGPVKKKVEEIAALLLVDRARQKFGLEAPR